MTNQTAQTAHNHTPLLPDDRLGRRRQESEGAQPKLVDPALEAHVLSSKGLSAPWRVALCDLQLVPVLETEEGAALLYHVTHYRETGKYYAESPLLLTVQEIDSLGWDDERLIDIGLSRAKRCGLTPGLQDPRSGRYQHVLSGPYLVPRVIPIKK